MLASTVYGTVTQRSWNLLQTLKSFLYTGPSVKLKLQLLAKMNRFSNINSLANI